MPSGRSVVFSSTSSEHVGEPEAPLRRDTASLELGVADGDVRVEARARGRRGVDGHEHVGPDPFKLRYSRTRSATVARSSSLVGPRFDPLDARAVIAVTGRRRSGLEVLRAR